MSAVDLSEYAGLLEEHSELRVQENRSLGIALVDGKVMSNDQSVSSGVSARAYRGGLWGFASHPEIGPQSIRAVIQAATDNARFLAAHANSPPRRLPSSPGRSSSDLGTSKPRKTQRELLEFLQALDAWIQGSCPGLSSRTLSLQCLDMEKSLLTSDGAAAYSRVPRCFVVAVMATQREDTPYELFDLLGGGGHFEDVFSGPQSLLPALQRLYEDLRRKAEGVYPEAGIADCVLAPELAGILAHEAIGHTTEADLVLGGSVAGERVGQQVASPLVSMTDFASEAEGATCPVPVYVDDEGTLARDAVLIQEGVLKGFMHSRETALQFSAEPTGNARAFSFSDEPLIRMRNTAILPGASTLEEMIASVQQGYYLIRSGNGEADSTSEFMFGIELGYEIRKGKVARALKDTTISGVAFDMLKTVSMVSRDMHWVSAGMCGKKQLIPVGMGGPAVKCRVTIGGR